MTLAGSLLVLVLFVVHVDQAPMTTPQSPDVNRHIVIINGTQYVKKGSIEEPKEEGAKVPWYAIVGIVLCFVLLVLMAVGVICSKRRKARRRAAEMEQRTEPDKSVHNTISVNLPVSKESKKKLSKSGWSSGLGSHPDTTTTNLSSNVSSDGMGEQSTQLEDCEPDSAVDVTASLTGSELITADEMVSGRTFSPSIRLTSVEQPSERSKKETPSNSKEKTEATQNEGDALNSASDSTASDSGSSSYMSTDQSVFTNSVTDYETSSNTY
jgi:hypothetical protein